MFYSHPEQEAAYTCGQQYWFGSELIAAPFTAPADADTRLSRQTVWLPEGDWFDFFTGERLTGGGWRTVYGGLDDMPIFAKAGAIVPLASEVGWGGVENPDALRLRGLPRRGQSLRVVRRRRRDDGLPAGALRADDLRSGVARRRAAFQHRAGSRRGGRRSGAAHV